MGQPRPYTEAVAVSSRERARRAKKYAEVTLIFDGQCGFCTRCVSWVERLDQRGHVKAIAFQCPGVPERYGLTSADCSEAVWAIDADGGTHRGGEAVNVVLAAALRSSLPVRLYRLPGIQALQDRVYLWVSHNRGRLWGVTPWCATHPSAGCVKAD